MDRGSTARACPPMNVHCFECDDAWWVVAGAATDEFVDRASAFEAAKGVARATTPSQLVLAAPDGWRRPVAAAATTPSRAGAPSTTSGDPAVDWTVLAGPASLGRSVLVAPGAEPPGPWGASPRVSVTPQCLSDPRFLVDVRDGFLSRARVVYEVDPEIERPPPGIRAGDVWATPVDHEFVEEATWALLTSNSVDARPGAIAWPLADCAAALGAERSADADVLLPDGRSAWCDGGAIRLWSKDHDGADLTVVPRESIELGGLMAVHACALDADLASDQLEAVADPDVRARIIAPAGSGKTRVLTERARHLLRSSVPSDALTVVAFNKRAQLEIAERTHDLPGLHVQTLNALALSILNGTKGFAARASRVDTIDEPAVRDLLGSLVKFVRRANTDPAASWIDALSRVRLGLSSPRVVEAAFGGEVEGLTEVFSRYRAELLRRGVVDFDEQIYRCIELLLAEPEVRQHAQRRCQLLLVDEFQDLTPAHMLLLRLLAGPTLSIFGVGDDDQTIYGYSGATPEWLVGFDAYVPAATHHALTVNYRCPVPVVDAAATLLSWNRNRVTKEIRPGPNNASSPASLGIRLVESPTAETTAVVEQLLAQGARTSEIAVLTRVNSLLAPIQAFLGEAAIPVQLRDGLGFLSRTGVSAALAWLRLAVEPAQMSRADLAQAARRPSRGISPRVIEWIGEQSDVAGVERLAARISDGRSSDKVAAFAADLKRAAARASTATAASLIEFTSSEIGLARSMQTLDEAHIGRNSQAHSDDLRALIALGQVHPDPRTFSAWLARSLSTPGVPGGVTLATVHRVKGLEWPHVIVHDASSGMFPHRLSTDVEEERRVFHVAITRARATLHLVADAASPSMFLSELATPRSDDDDDDDDGDAERAPTPTKTKRETKALEASVGLMFRWGGYYCTVQDVEHHRVTVSIGSSTITIPLESEVAFDGGTRCLVAPRTSSSRSVSSMDGAAASPEVMASLKAWRLERSRKDVVPAYVVASNKTLECIAVAMPSSEAELLAVNGIGATKVELYGEEILAVLDDVRPG